MGKYRVLFIGDVHGKSDWEQITQEAIQSMNVKEIVFLGDYFDARNKKKYPATVQYNNLKHIIRFKKRTEERKFLPVKVTLLLGNHDYAYLHKIGGISGYQYENENTFSKLLQENIDMFKLAWGITEEDGYYTLATHAGLTKSFFDKEIISEYKEGGFLNRFFNRDYIDENLDIILNLLIDKKDKIFNIGPERGGTKSPGPIWADHIELMNDPYPNINQIVGHSMNYAISIDNINNNKIYRIDTYWDNIPALTITFNK